MSSQPARSQLAIALAIIIAGVLISTSVFIAVNETPGTKTKTTTTTQVNTSTAIQTTTITSVLTNSGVTTYTPPQVSQRVTILNDIWNFTAFTSANMVSQSNYLFVTASLTNISPVNQTIGEPVQPTIYLSIYAANGSSVWTFKTSSIWPNNTVGRGQSPGAGLSIPMSALTLGQSYSLRINPMSISTASNMTITMHFVVTSGSSLPPSKATFLLNVNGSWYWADDISNDISIGAPGYSYFLNGSVIFDGVKFQTICPSNYRDCPGSNSSSTIMYAGDIQVNLTFPDKTNETIANVIGDSTITYVLSQHDSPRAGMFIEYVNDYPHNSVPYAVFLLVSSCGGAPNFC